MRIYNFMQQKCGKLYPSPLSFTQHCCIIETLLKDPKFPGTHEQYESLSYLVYASLYLIFNARCMTYGTDKTQLWEAFIFLCNNRKTL